MTDSQFIFSPHVAQIEAAGFTVERLDKLAATPDELIEGLRDKAGYILGGIERVPAEVIEEALDLRAIAFCGSGFREFIPGYKAAFKRGIRISAARGANARAVAEFVLAVLLADCRRLVPTFTPEGTYPGATRELSGLTVGVVGMGAIGSQVEDLLSALGATVLACNRATTASDAEFHKVLGKCDVVTLHVSSEHGEGVLNRDAVAAVATGALLINCAFREAWAESEVVARAESGEIRISADYGSVPIGEGFRRSGVALVSNVQSGFNTVEANWRTSDRATASMLNLLAGRSDPDEVKG